MPDAPKNVPAVQQVFLTFWFTTRLGVRYELPDSLEYQIQNTLTQLRNETETITAVNISSVVMAIPFRIIQRAGDMDPETGVYRTLWESEP
jgi:hypothetical protein